MDNKEVTIDYVNMETIMEGSYQTCSELMDKYQAAVYANSVAVMSGCSSTDIQRILRLSYVAEGLCEESGEVAGKIKKLIRNHLGELSETRKVELIKELGDVLWYVAAMATELNVKLSTVAELNLSKLSDRQDRGVIASEGDTR